MSRFAIMLLQKVHTFGHIAGLKKHVERERETRNADPERTLPLNERLIGSGDWVADVRARLAVAPVVRSNAVIAIEHLQTGSAEFFTAGTAEEQDHRRDAWRDASMTWLRETYGADNIVAAVEHRDESVPHIHALIVPIDARGRLCARGFLGGTRARLIELQDSYAAAVAPLGLIRGVYRSVASHEEIRHWYAQMQEPPWGMREMAAAVEIEPPGHVVAHPQEYAQEQRWRVLTTVAPRLEAMARQNEHLSRQVALQERQIVAQSERERAAQAGRAHLRQVDLGTVITALGGERDPSARSRWSLGGEAISVDGERWRNHARQQEGYGAIELVQVFTGYDHRQAVAYLRHEVGADTAVVAAAHHAQQIAEREPAPPFRAPEPDPQRWPQVRAYLAEERGLPGQWVDALHEQGKVYSDGRGNAVFLRQNEQGEATGAYLRGTAPERTFGGLVAGTRRDGGCFSASLPGKQRDGSESPPTLLIAKSPIDALSVLELHRRLLRDRESGPVMAVSMDGAGALPHQAIRDTLGRGGTVRVATDGSDAGERTWRQLHKQYPEPQVRRDCPELKDWNDVLRWSNVCMRDPKRADRELHEMQTRNAPDARSRAALRETLRRWAPGRDSGRDGYDR